MLAAEPRSIVSSSRSNNHLIIYICLCLVLSCPVLCCSLRVSLCSRHTSNLLRIPDGLVLPALRPWSSEYRNYRRVLPWLAVCFLFFDWSFSASFEVSVKWNWSIFSKSRGFQRLHHLGPNWTSCSLRHCQRFSCWFHFCSLLDLPILWTLYHLLLVYFHFS